MFTEIRTDHVDDKGVIHIDGYKDFDENSEGKGIGYFINGEVYWRDPEYQFDPLVAEVVKELKAQPNKFVLANIDYEELKSQKLDLVKVIEQIDGGSDLEKGLTGILHLIDSLQDYAVDVMGKIESEVFNLTNS